MKHENSSLPVGKLHFGLGHWPGSGPPVFMIHGLTANQTCWGFIAESLQSAGFDVWAMDLRGRGKSDKPVGAYGVDVHLEDAAAVIQALGLRPVMLIGHSLGAMVALHLAARYPALVLKLVLVDGGGVVTFSQATKAIQAIRPALARLGKVFENEAAYVGFMRSRIGEQAWNRVFDAYYHYEAEPLPGGGAGCNIPLRVIEAEFQGQGGSLSARRALVRLIFRYRYVKKRLELSRNPPYSRIQAETLILQAGHYNREPGDEILPNASLQTMLQQIPHAQSQTIPDVNHYSIVFAENSVRDTAIIQFLKA